MHWTIAHMILDLVQNSVEAGAGEIILTIDDTPPGLQVGIRDNGRGMDATRQAAALDPFFTEPGKHPGRRVGLGLPFLLQTVEQTGGSWEINSEPERGTTLQFTLATDHVDMPPRGDLAELMVDLMCFDGDYELTIERYRSGSEFRITRTELQEALGGITTAGARRTATDFLRTWEVELASG